MTDPSVPLLFLIVEADLYVADDLTEIIRETVSGAQVIHSPEVDKFTLEIVDEMAIFGVFLGGFPEDAGLRDIVAGLTQRGVAVARTGKTGDRQIASGETDDRTAFTADAIAAVLNGWLDRRVDTARPS
ncbi:hypothetical protein N9W17_01345 [Jannaschia sp.]|nr:hypothetical protein [Jannaschia sp.]